MCSTPKIGTDSPPSAPLDTIHEADTPTHAGAKRLPPPTLPKPKARPLPPPKPKKSVQEINGSGEMFQVRFLGLNLPADSLFFSENHAIFSSQLIIL